MTHPPRNIAILGAGPTGLEAALAANESGFPFTLYEAGSAVGDYIRSWAHVRLFSPWSLDISPRARKELEASGHSLPDALSDDCPMGGEILDRVLEPLARLPEIAPRIRTGVTVKAVAREGLLKNEEIGTAARSRRPFRLLLTDSSGREWSETAAVVIDTTGTYGHPNSTGDGGIPAPGETDLGSTIVRRIPDVATEPEAWAGRTTLLVGSGHSAQTALVALAELARQCLGTRVIWALRSSRPSWRIDPQDPLPARSALTAEARRLATGASSSVTTRTGSTVDGFAAANGRIQVTLRSVSNQRSLVVVDRVLSLTGSVGDHSLYRQLQVHECYATSGPMKLAAALLGDSSSDCLAQESHGAETLVNPEPDFFILGSKSYGRNATFLMRVGWQQVDEVFGLLAPA